MATTDQAVSGVAGRYAAALFDLASENKSVPATGAALASFATLIEGSDELRRLLRSPVFKAEDQEEAIASLASKAGIDGLALNFLKLMAKNRRLATLPGAIAAYQMLVAKAKGEVTAEVTSAEKLSATQLADLRTALKSAVGSDVALAAKVNPAILGGLIVKVGSRMLDNSLLTKLNSLKSAMKGHA